DERDKIKDEFRTVENFLQETINDRLAPTYFSKGKIQYLLTSAKTGKSVNDIFNQIAKNLIDIYYFKDVAKDLEISAEECIEKIGKTDENINKVIESLSKELLKSKKKLEIERPGKVEIDLFEVLKKEVEHEIKRPEIEIPDEVKALSLITSIPRGLPSSLWGINVETLAKLVANAEYRKTSDGEIILKIKDRWYYGDCTDLGIFLQEYRMPVK
ncbi:MAG: hypothetical protein AB1779_09070, partial [Candidatus Thermoplasmatota archaeon]